MPTGRNRGSSGGTFTRAKRRSPSSGSFTITARLSDSVEMYACDARCRTLVKRGLRAGVHRGLQPIERSRIEQMQLLQGLAQRDDRRVMQLLQGIGELADAQRAALARPLAVQA